MLSWDKMLSLSFMLLKNFFQKGSLYMSSLLFREASSFVGVLGEEKKLLFFFSRHPLERFWFSLSL
jgi:hypothetical protein